jgi:hypothetical protein
MTCDTKTKGTFTFAEAYEGHYVISWERPEGDNTPGRPALVVTSDELNDLKELLLEAEAVPARYTDRIKRLEDTLQNLVTDFTNIDEMVRALRNDVDLREYGVRMATALTSVLAEEWEKE